MTSKQFSNSLSVLRTHGADAAFASIMKAQKASFNREQQKKKWANEKKTARRKGTW